MDRLFVATRMPVQVQQVPEVMAFLQAWQQVHQVLMVVTPVDL
jgi:hypothetical protein